MRAPPLSIAPMMDRTDRHYRAMMRHITRHTLLYTEMITAAAIVHGDTDYLLAYSQAEHPVALQLGGDDPRELAVAARAAADRGYDEVNLNVGCPSDRVQSGRFGACLMARPERVAECVAAMREASGLPITVKHRIGIDDIDQYEHMLHFVDVVQAAGPVRFSVHARKAWLQGLSPKENRNVPPLRYGEVHRLKLERPHLQIEINGGIVTLDQAQEHLAHVDAVMIGRAAWDDPYLFAQADARFFDDATPPKSRHQVVRAMLEHAEDTLQRGGRLMQVVKPLLNLFAGQRGSRAFKRHLSENAWRPGAGPEVLEAALSRVPDPAEAPAPRAALAASARR